MAFLREKTILQAGKNNVTQSVEAILRKSFYNPIDLPWQHNEREICIESLITRLYRLQAEDTHAWNSIKFSHYLKSS